MKKLLKFASLLILIIGTTSTAKAIAPVFQQKVVDENGIPGDTLGNSSVSVSSSGDRLIVSNAYDDEIAKDAGAAIIYELNEVGTWQQVATLTAPDGQEGDNFGSSVLIEGGLAFVGDMDHRYQPEQSNRAFTGRVHVYVRSQDGVWQPQQILTGSFESIDGGPEKRPGQFGASLSLSGGRLLIGAPRSYIGVALSGSVYVFEQDSSGNWIESSILYPEDSLASRSDFGSRVAVDGNTALVGAVGHDELASNAGAAYLFEINENTGEWNQSRMFQAVDGRQSDAYGVAVALEGNVAIVGARQKDEYDSNGVQTVRDNGAAYIYEKGLNWNEASVQKLIASDPGALDYFGTDVAISDGRVVISAFRGEAIDEYNSTGSVYVFQKSAGVWEESDIRILGSQPTYYDFFGTAIDFSGNTLMVTSPADEDPGITTNRNANYGSAEVFCFTSGEDVDQDGLDDACDPAVFFDTDGDGMPDDWEIENGLNPYENDANSDFDGDGLLNIQEYQSNTDPQDPDSDGDGLLDGEEVHSHLTDPNLIDSDFDGVHDRTEVIWGLDPVNSSQFSIGGDSDEDKVILHVLNRLSFGATTGLFKRLKYGPDENGKTSAERITEWINEQFISPGIPGESERRAQATISPNHGEPYPRPVRPVGNTKILAPYPGSPYPPDEDDDVENGHDGQVVTRDGLFIANPPPLNGVYENCELKTQEVYPEYSMDSDGNYDVSEWFDRGRCLRDNFRSYFFGNRPEGYMPNIQAIRPIHSNQSLRVVMEKFWDNHFSTDLKTATKQQTQTELYEADTFFINAFGNFKELLLHSARSATMIQMLNSNENKRPFPQENYAREVMELHTLGVDGGYSQDDVFQLARIFTGWSTNADHPSYSNLNSEIHRNGRYRFFQSYREPTVLDEEGVMISGGLPKSAVDRTQRILYEFEQGQLDNVLYFWFNPANHDDGTVGNDNNQYLGPKLFLNHSISSRTGEAGVDEGIEALGILARHPSTAKFVCTKLGRLFIADSPAENLINGCSDVFLAYSDAENQMEFVVRYLINRGVFPLNDSNPTIQSSMDQHAQYHRGKVKDAWEYGYSFARLFNIPTTESPFDNTLIDPRVAPSLNGYISNSRFAGSRMYNISGLLPNSNPSPEGDSELSEDWVSTSEALKRFNSVKTGIGFFFPSSGTWFFLYPARDGRFVFTGHRYTVRKSLIDAFIWRLSSPGRYSTCF